MAGYTERDMKMADYVKVAVDAMGGDNAPGEIVKGAVDAVCAEKKIKVFLVGKEEQVKAELSKYTYPQEQVEVVNATEVIAMAEPPVAAIRGKKDSSIVKGLYMVREGKCDAFVSAGSTGAVLAGGQVIVGRSKGVERPPLAPLIPTMLKACSDINFIGSIEARDIPAGAVDVVVCEAFVGNVVLKLYEGVGSTLIKKVKGGMMVNLRSKIGALLVKPALKQTLKAFDLEQYGGAPLLGLKGLVVKTHGSSKAVEIKNTILQCVTFKEQDINGKIQKVISGAAE